MIRLQNLTPEVYYKESRDFQFLGRLFDLVLNSVKTEADLLYNIPLSDNSDTKLLELLAMTLGFKPKHQYNARQLKAICSVFSEILKNKGSIKSLKIACEALFNAMDINQELDYDFTEGTDKTELNLYISQEFEDLIILNDLLGYIIPAGMSYNIIREFHIKNTSNTNIGLSDTVNVKLMDNTNLSRIVKLTTTNKDSYNSVSGTTIDTNATTTNIVEVIPGFSINSEIVKLEDTNNG
jgi:hypothetical protein